MKQPSRLRFPIRFKILVALLLIITTVVSGITFTMANLFHEDKLAYVHDLTSEMAVHSAEETRAWLEAIFLWSPFGRLAEAHHRRASERS